MAQRVTTIAVEVLVLGSGPGERATGVAAEVLVAPDTNRVRVTTTVAEVLRPRFDELSRTLEDSAPILSEIPFSFPGRSVADIVSTSESVASVSDHPRTTEDTVPAPTDDISSVRGVPRPISDTTAVSESIVYTSLRPFIHIWSLGALGSGEFSRPFDVLSPIATGGFTRSWNVGTRSAGSFVRPFDVEGAQVGYFERPFDVIAASGAPPSGVTPPTSGWAGSVLTADAFTGDLVLQVGDTTDLQAGDLIEVGGAEYRVVTAVTSTSVTIASGLGADYVAGTAVTAVSGFLPDAMWVFDKGGNPLGAIHRYTVTAARRWLINGMGDFAFYVPRTSPEQALIEGDRLLAIESSVGLPLWAGTMLGLRFSESRITVTAADVFSLLTKLPVTYKAEGDTPAVTILSDVIDLANEQKAAVGDITFAIVNEGSEKMVFSGVDFEDSDPWDIFSEVQRRSAIDFTYDAAITTAGALVLTIHVYDRLLIEGVGGYFDGPGGNVAGNPEYNADYGTAYSGIKLTGIAGQVADCLPDWAAWAAEDLLPQVTVERDPGPRRKRITLELDASFGFSQEAISALCQQIEDYLRALYLTFVYAYHDMFGKPWYPEWTYEGPPARYEPELNTGLGWRTRRRLMTWAALSDTYDYLASMVMKSHSEGKALIVWYNRIHGVKHVKIVYYNAQPGTQYVYQCALHGWDWLYTVTGGVITDRRFHAFDHDTMYVSAQSVEIMWIRDVAATADSYEQGKLEVDEPAGSASVLLKDGQGDRFHKGAVTIGTEDRNIDHINGDRLYLTNPTKSSHPAGSIVTQKTAGTDAHTETVFKTLRRITDESGAGHEGEYIDMTVPMGPTSGVRDQDGNLIFVKPVVGDDPYKVFSWVPSPDGDRLDSQDVTEVYPFERHRIEFWDPRVDGVGVLSNKETVWKNQPSTRERWHLVPWGVGGDRTTSLLVGLHDDPGGATQMYVESPWDFLTTPLPFPVTVGYEENAEVVTVTKIRGQLWDIIRSDNVNVRFHHDIGEPVVLEDTGEEDSLIPIPGLDTSWPEGTAWAEQLLDHIAQPTRTVSLRLVNRDDAWANAGLGTTHPIDLSTEGRPGGIHGVIRLIGRALNEATGEMETLIEWQEDTD